MAHTTERALQQEDQTAYEEKNGTSKEHIETAASNDSTDSDYDINNKYAVKGDNSDGKVEWNWKTRVAASCLILLYVSKSIFPHVRCRP